MTSIEVRGGDRFRAVTRRLRGAADRKDLVRELRSAILDAVPVLKDAVRNGASEYLPDRYAAELVPTLRMTTATNVAGDQVTVRISTVAKGAKGHPRQVGDLEDGRLKHPVHGRTRALRRHALHRATSMTNPWVTQQVKPHMVTEPMAAGQPAVRKEIEAAVDRVLQKITGA